jgi:N,N'-diacetyllegionaminate synthase
MITLSHNNRRVWHVAGREFSNHGATLMIAEEGQANDGDFDLALRMIRLAASCGADGIEFQLSIAADLYVTGDDGFRIYQKRQFTAEQINELVAATHESGILFQAACVSDRLVEVVARAGADALVVNSMDLNNPRMLDAVAGSDKPFLIATLMGTLEEIDWAVSRVRARGGSNFALLHGQHIMTSDHGASVPLRYTQLNCIEMLANRYDVPVGFVDHTNTEIIPAIAVGHGAIMVTKHLAPQVDWHGPDWQVCLAPDAWKRACQYLRDASAARGADKTLSIEEVSDRSQMRRSIVASREIPRGKQLEVADICFKRPGGGLDPRDYEKYVGRRAMLEVPADQLLAEEMFEAYQ